jgi:endothelin-converting enzyme
VRRGKMSSSNQQNAVPAANSYGGRASMESDAGEQDSLLPTSATSGNGASGPRSFLDRVKNGISNVLAPLAEPEMLRPLERALLILTLVLFLLASIFIGLFAGAQHKLHHDTPGWGQPIPPGPGQPPESPGDGNTPNGPGHSEPPSSGSDGICFTRECVLTASDILRGMDESINPCDDFYQFAAGGWLGDHSIPADAGLFGAGQFVAANNAKIIEGLLQDKKAVKKQPDEWDQKSITMLKGWYEGCTNSESQNRLGNEPLMEVLQEIKDHFSKEEDEKHLLFTEQRNPIPPNMPPGRSPRPHRPSDSPVPLPPAPGGRSSRQARLTRALAWQHSRGLPALFEFGVDGDAGKDPNLGTPTFYANGLGFPDKEYYEDEKELDFYKETVKQAFLAVRAELKKAEKDEEKEADEDWEGYYADDAEASRKKKHKKGAKFPSKSTFISMAHAVVEFEQALADITPDGGNSDPITTYNPSNMTMLSYDLRSIDWPTYFSALTVRPPKTVIISEPTYVRRLDSLISRTRDEVLEAYFFWTAIRTLGLNLGPSATLRKPADRLDRRSKGVEEDAEEDRSTTCLSSLNEALGFMAGRFFVREAFSPEAKSKAEGIIGGIIDAFKTRLPELDWLDVKTRNYAEEKADAVRIKVGYPESYPVTTDSKVIYEFYNDLKVNASDHFGNVLRSQARLARRMWSYTDRRLNAGRWDMFPAEVNAYYNPPGNESECRCRSSSFASF